MDLAKDKKTKKTVLHAHEQQTQNNTKRREPVLHDQEVFKTIPKKKIEVRSQ